MNQYRLSQRAEQDLENIWIYVAQKNEVAADLLLAKLLDQFPMLAQFPEMGYARNELMLGIRCFPVKPDNIFYRKLEVGIEIFRVLHQSRELDERFNDSV
jgi:toxin ParE1/3/4